MSSNRKGNSTVTFNSSEVTQSYTHTQTHTHMKRKMIEADKETGERQGKS